VVWMEFISWLSAVANVTHTYQIDWIFRILRFEISLWHCKKESYRLKLRCKNHLSLQPRPELREMSLSRRLTNAPRVLAITWSAAKVEWLLFGGRGKPGAEIPEKIPPCTGKNQAQPISTGRICSRAAALSALLITSARAMPTKTLRANKFVRSGKRALHEFSSASSKNIP
jgi:hypothetical protein